MQWDIIQPPKGGNADICHTVNKPQGHCAEREAGHRRTDMRVSTVRSPRAVSVMDTQAEWRLPGAGPGAVGSY